MGYDTQFEGEFVVDPPLSEEHEEYLKAFCNTRRMKRDARKATKLPDSRREAVGLPVGVQGEFYVGSVDDGHHGQVNDESVVEHNDPPRTQPSLWCDWIPAKHGEIIHWCGRDKFHDYVQWIRYIIKNFVQRWGYELNGEVRWRGDDFEDIGTIVIKNNKVNVRKPKWD
jgi:hypothetical protein